MKIREALETVGNLSKPTKMPGFSYSLPAHACKTGSKLRQRQGTICSKCYACKGRYVFSNVQNALERRLKAINDKDWVEAMVTAIKHHGCKHKHFRWHDSGDVQSLKHLLKIIQVAKRVPEVQFWLPTKETKIVKLAKRNGHRMPKNLVIRHSEPMIGQKPNKELRGLNTTTVESGHGFICPVKSGTEGCDTYNCRACWNKKIRNVDHHAH